MYTTSIWGETTSDTKWPSLDDDITADVVVVGGGITGVTAALRVAEAGRSVALLEGYTIGAGDTGNSTGNLYETVSGGLLAITEKWGIEVARRVAASRRETVDSIEQQATAIGKECGFRRCAMYQYAGTPDAQQQVGAEADAMRAAGLPAHLQDSLPAGPPAARGPVLVLDNQAQFHPLAYVRALAAKAAGSGCKVYEHSAVIEVDKSRHIVRTAGGSVRAAAIVLATHSPSGFHLLQAGMMPSREYGLAWPIDAGSFPAGTFWAQGQDRLSVRSLCTDAGDFVICVGQQQPSGQHDARSAMAALENAARRRLGVNDFAFRWSAQNFRSPDLLPYIGKDRSDSYVATGFSTDGLVYGTLAASIIGDEILGRDNRWSDLYKATRFEPVKSAGSTAKETLSVAKSVLQDYLTRRQHEQLSALRPGDGAIVEIDGERLATYRSPDGTVFAVSPVCTHLKCQVHWNDVEASWDCPCHGSRFAPDGRVISGPAIEPLARKLPAPD
jgi:glycine/D-amino acid oxidase-like deaminating enzyme/nitrite reductase/ring-hydroxylating ferredoxin subunit